MACSAIATCSKRRAGVALACQCKCCAGLVSSPVWGRSAFSFFCSPIPPQSASLASARVHTAGAPQLRHLRRRHKRTSWTLRMLQVEGVLTCPSDRRGARTRGAREQHVPRASREAGQSQYKREHYVCEGTSSPEVLHRNTAPAVHYESMYAVSVHTVYTVTDQRSRRLRCAS